MDIDSAEHIQTNSANWELLKTLFWILQENADQFNIPVSPRMYILADWGYQQGLITEIELAQIKSQPNYVF